MKKCVIFVHPCMSIQLSFALAKEYGYKIFSIITSAEIHKINASMVREMSDYTYCSNMQVENHILEIKQIIQSNQLNVCAVINGIDACLYYSDYLHNELVGVPKVDLQFSKVRLNKYETNKIIESSGIPIIPSVELTCVDDIITKDDEIKKLNWPIIGKPSENTASMAGFGLINTPEELKRFVEKSIGAKNAYYNDVVVEKLILQEYIPIDKYDEFAIDFLSYNGNHYLQAVVHYEKIRTSEGEMVNKVHRALLPSEVPNLTLVIEYLIKILIALKVTHGITHNEVFWDRKNKFYLIESNNRLPGSGLIDQYNYCYGYTALHSLFRLIENEDEIPQVPSVRKGHCCVIKLYNFFVKNPKMINLTGIKSNPQVITFYPDKMVDINFGNYTRADCIAAHVLLTNQSLAELEADIAEIEDREKNNNLFLA